MKLLVSVCWRNQELKNQRNWKKLDLKSSSNLKKMAQKNIVSSN